MTPRNTTSTEESTGATHVERNVAGRLLTINEVAELTGLAVGTLYHFVSQKRIPVVRLSKRCIRFRQTDLSDWIQTLTQGVR